MDSEPEEPQPSLPTDTYETTGLLERLPSKRRFVMPLIGYSFQGKTELPPDVSARQALALAAFAQARARGIVKAQRVYDLVLRASDPRGKLVVAWHYRGVELVPSRNFEPTSAVVIDLDELSELLASGADIPA